MPSSVSQQLMQGLFETQQFGGFPIKLWPQQDFKILKHFYWPPANGISPYAAEVSLCQLKRPHSSLCAIAHPVPGWEENKINLGQAAVRLISLGEWMSSPNVYIMGPSVVAQVGFFFFFNIFIAQKPGAQFQTANMLIFSPGLDSSCWKKTSNSQPRRMAQTSCSLLAGFGCAACKVWQIMQRNKCKRTVPRSKLRCWSSVVLVELPLGCCQLHLGRKEMQIKRKN